VCVCVCRVTVDTVRRPQHVQCVFLYVQLEKRCDLCNSTAPRCSEVQPDPTPCVAVLKTARTDSHSGTRSAVRECSACVCVRVTWCVCRAPCRTCRCPFAPRAVSSLLLCVAFGVLWQRHIHARIERAAAREGSSGRRRSCGAGGQEVTHLGQSPSKIAAAESSSSKYMPDEHVIEL
jgi:hypothetical protein